MFKKYYQCVPAKTEDMDVDRLISCCCCLCGGRLAPRHGPDPPTWKIQAVAAALMWCRKIITKEPLLSQYSVLAVIMARLRVNVKSSI